MKNCCCGNATDAEILAKSAAIAAAAKGHEEKLIDVLTDVQAVANNGVAKDVAKVIANEMGIPLAKVYGVESFYAFFSEAPRGKNIIRMCKSAPCHVKGAKEVLAAFEEALGIKCGETTPDGKFTLETCECLGICQMSPAVLINDKVYGELTPAKVKEVIALY